MTFISPETIYTDVESSSFEEIIHQMSIPLIENNVVSENYPEKVIERERVFPTALPVQPFGVAIPHTDSDYVNENHISVAILKKPISMGIMGGNLSDKTDVKIIFLLSLNERNKQLNILQKIIAIIQDADNLRILSDASKDEIYNLLNDKL